MNLQVIIYFGLLDMQVLFISIPEMCMEKYTEYVCSIFTVLTYTKLL